MSIPLRPDQTIGIFSDEPEEEADETEDEKSLRKINTNN